MSEIYVVMWESWDGYAVNGGDLYYSLSEDKANAFRDAYAQREYDDLIWDEDNEIWIYRSKYVTNKIYTVDRPLDEEL